MNTAENAFLAFYHLFVIHVPPMIAKHPMYLKGLQKDAFCNSGLPKGRKLGFGNVCASRTSEDLRFSES